MCTPHPWRNYYCCKIINIIAYMARNRWLPATLYSIQHQLPLSPSLPINLSNKIILVKPWVNTASADLNSSIWIIVPSRFARYTRRLRINDVRIIFCAQKIRCTRFRTYTAEMGCGMKHEGLYLLRIRDFRQ